jgi:hypothetical protein
MRSALCVWPAALASLAAILAAANSLSPGVDGLTVHEWGTFTSLAAQDGSASEWDALGCKDDLPGFVADGGYRGLKWRLQGTVRMETPVMYFYSPRELEAQVKVWFPHGVITEWYPNGKASIYESKTLLDQVGRGLPSPIYSGDAIYPAASLPYPTPQDLDSSLVKLDPSLNGIDTSLRHLLGSIEWHNIQIQPHTSPALPIENKPSRYYAARATGSAPLEVGEQHEKFLFYRGVARIPVPLTAGILPGGAIQVQSVGGETIPGVILFENRGGHLGYRNVGRVAGGATIGLPSLDGAWTALRNELEAALVAQGLFPTEAQAMIDTWRDSWFEEGTRLIYIVPSGTVDTILPFEVEPAPSQVSRVFVGRIELITAETERVVEKAAARSDWAVLDRYSRFLGPILKQLYAADPAKISEIERTYKDSREARGFGGCQ